MEVAEGSALNVPERAISQKPRLFPRTGAAIRLRFPDSRTSTPYSRKALPSFTTSSRLRFFRLCPRSIWCRIASRGGFFQSRSSRVFSCEQPRPGKSV